jgi:eukaryotic-like serine/threonine-protein kinase
MNSAPLIPASAPCAVVGRYAIYDEIAAGGMATVHLGKLVGAGGFSRLVAIKRLHPNFAKDAEFVDMFMDEARLAARIHHPNVVQTLDVVTVEKELLLVMEYVHGMSFAALLSAAKRAGQRVDPRIAAAVIAATLEGLHAAHEAKSETGTPLGVVHRDVSPQNILVGVEGVARILDFGVAKAVGKMHATRDGQLKGKLAYMSPEQVRTQEVTRQSDVFSTAVVLWEAIMGDRLFDGNNPAELIWQVISDPIPTPRSRFPELPPALDEVVMKGLARDTAARYATARDMAEDLEAAVGLASPREIAKWVEAMAGDTLGARRQLVSSIEQAPVLSELESVERVSERSLPVESGTRPKPAPSEMAAQERTWPQASKPPRSGLGAEIAFSSGPPPQAAAPLDPRPDGMGLGPRSLEPGLSPSSPSFGGMLDVAAPGPPPQRPRRIPIPVEPEADHLVSLRERLETPLKVVAAGVVVALVDMAVRQYTASLPVRPLWVAEVLVVVGVLWALARVVLPQRGSRD